MKTFVFKFNNKWYKAQGITASSILASMFTISQLRKLKFQDWEEIN